MTEPSEAASDAPDPERPEVTLRPEDLRPISELLAERRLPEAALPAREVRHEGCGGMWIVTLSALGTFCAKCHQTKPAKASPDV